MKIKVLNNFIIGKNHLGKAVFAARVFKPGDVIVKFEGNIVTKDAIPTNLAGVDDRFVQVGIDTYLGPSGDADDFINHSCDPNAGLKFSPLGIILVAIKDINIGEEITWDYSTTLYDNPWKMVCHCGAQECRKVIGDFMLLDPVIQQKYRMLDIIPPYIKEYMESKDYLVYTEGLSRLRSYEQQKN